MKPVVSIIMGSTSDLPVMEKAAKLLDECEIPFEMLALSDDALAQRLADYKEGLKEKIVKANADLSNVKYSYKTN